MIDAEATNYQVRAERMKRLHEQVFVMLNVVQLAALARRDPDAFWVWAVHAADKLREQQVEIGELKRKLAGVEA